MYDSHVGHQRQQIDVQAPTCVTWIMDATSKNIWTIVLGATAALSIRTESYINNALVAVMDFLATRGEKSNGFGAQVVLGKGIAFGQRLGQRPHFPGLDGLW